VKSEREECRWIKDCELVKVSDEIHEKISLDSVWPQDFQADTERDHERINDPK
jgi:hypothetical protein